MTNISGYMLITENMNWLADATIKSMLPIVDEVYVGNNKDIVDYHYLKDISPKVKPAAYGFDPNDIDSVCNVLSDMRSKCEGDWCLFLREGEILHEKDTDSILCAVETARDNQFAVNVRYVNSIGGYVIESDFINVNLGYEATKDSPHRQILTRNRWFIKHCLPNYMNNDPDYIPYYDERTGWEFIDPSANYIDSEYKFPIFIMHQDYPKRSINAIDYLLNHYTYVWNYRRFLEPMPENNGWLEMPYFTERQPKLVADIMSNAQGVTTHESC